MVLRCWLNPSLASVMTVPRLQFSLKPYPSTCWMVQRLTSSRLASSRWLTPLDPLLPDVFPLLLGQERSPARETALGPCLSLNPPKG